MQSAFKKVSLVGLLGAGILLTACGGGGGGGVSGFTAPNIPQAAIALDSNNAETVAGESYSSIEGTQSASSFVPLGLAMEGRPSEIEVNLNNIVSNVIRDVIAQGPSAVKNSALRVVINESEACGYYDFDSNTEVPSGSISISGNVADPNAISDAGGMWSNGDYATMSFNSCAMGIEGWELNGKINFVVNADFDPSSVEDPSQCTGPAGCNASLEVTITNLVYTVGSIAVTIHGGFNLDWNITPTTWTQTQSGDSLYLVLNAGGQTEATEISNFNIENLVDFTSETYTVTASLTVASTVASGSVSVDASYGGDVDVWYDSITGYIDDVDLLDPNVGTITITGNNSSIEITSQPGYVSIEIDEDGDTVFDGSPIITDWSTLN